MNTKNHGGKRTGSGRRKVPPDLIKIPVCYKLPSWLVAWIREQDSAASSIIEESIINLYDLKPPTNK